MGTSAGTQTEIRIDARVFFAKPELDSNFFDQPGRKIGEASFTVDNEPVDFTVSVVPLSLVYGAGKMVIATAHQGNPKRYSTDQYSWVKVHDDGTSALIPNHSIKNLRD